MDQRNTKMILPIIDITHCTTGQQIYSKYCVHLRRAHITSAKNMWITKPQEKEETNYVKISDIGKIANIEFAGIEQTSTPVHIYTDQIE